MNILKINLILWKFFLFDFITNPSSLKQIKSLKQKIILILRISIFIAYNLNLIIFALAFGSAIFKKPYKIETILTGSLSIVHFFGVIIRYSSVHLKKTQILKILKYLPQDYSKEYQKRFNIQKDLKSFKAYRRRSICLYGGVVVTSFLGLTYDIVFGSSKMAKSLPFKASSSVEFWSMFIWINLTHFTFQAAILTMEVFQYGLIKILAIEFKILASNFESLGEHDKERNADQFKRKFGNKIFTSTSLIYRIEASKIKVEMDHLIPLIKRHNELFKVQKLLQNIFNIPFSIRFIQSAYSLFILAFHVTRLDNYRAFFIAGLFRNARFLFYQCYFGQLLRDASQSVADGVMNAKWEEIDDHKAKTDLLMILRRSQKPATFNVMKVFEISLRQFTAIMILAFSYYLVCWQIYKHRKH